MKIAILGWGSLIWDKRNLEVERSDQGAEWYLNGPILPIEFSRISNDGRLTLVIDSTNGTKVNTLYCMSKYKKIDEAILNLASREGCVKDKVGYYISGKKEELRPTKFEFKSIISGWCKLEKIEAVIWTNLKSNFNEKLGLDFSVENAISYLGYSTLESRVKAEEYIRRAPEQIKTSVRQQVEKQFGWNFII